MLNRVRVGIQSNQDIETLKSRIVPDRVRDLPRLRVCHTLKRVDDYNEEVLRTMNVEPIISTAFDSPKLDMPLDEAALTVLRLRVSRLPNGRNRGLPQSIKLAVQTQIVITCNLDVSDFLCNGKVGVAEKIDNQNNKPVLWIKFDNPKVSEKRRKKYRHLYTSEVQTNWTPIMKVYHNFYVKRGSTLTYFDRTQFKISLACAITIHKAQGDTYDSLECDFRARPVCKHLVYTAESCENP